jgi:hypothetical protein
VLNTPRRFYSDTVLMIDGMVHQHVEFSQVWSAEEYGLDTKTLTLIADDSLKLSAYEV